MPVYSWNLALPGDLDVIPPFPAEYRADKTTLATILGGLKPNGTNTVESNQAQALGNDIFFDCYNCHYDGSFWQRTDTAQAAWATQYHNDGAGNVTVNLVLAAAGGNPIGAAFPTVVPLYNTVGQLLSSALAPVNIQYLPAASGTYVVPANTRFLLVWMAGPGGPGGNGTSTSSTSFAGGGGGAGGGVIAAATTSLASSYAYTNGAGSSTFGTLTCNVGGTGGAAGGDGGVGGSAVIGAGWSGAAFSGEAGGPGQICNGPSATGGAAGGQGGSSIFGGGGRGGSPSAPNASGGSGNTGGGGGGASAIVNGAGGSGGNGAGGSILVLAA